MSLMAPMTPGATATATSGAGSSSAAVALPKVGQQARITCPFLATPGVCFVAFGNSAVAATAANGVPVLTDSSIIVTPPSEATHFAVFAAAATAVYVTSGMGE